MKKRLAGVAAASLFAIGLASSPALAASPNDGCGEKWNLWFAYTEADFAMDHNGDGFICFKNFEPNENANPERGNSDLNNEVIKDNNSPA